ncbi:MAG TPA: hemolysin family protein [Candidatus Eisenbacteria bacterium]|nr:hemolysin family protein [Candidatus Eisenbacteria bacterium]
MQPGSVAVALVLIFAGASFFFALAETALFSLSNWQAQQLAERDSVKGAMVVRLLGEAQDLLATMVLGNTFASAAMLATALWMALKGVWPLVPTITVLLALILIGCEVLPKTLAVRKPERWALRVARPLMILQRLALPLRHIAQRINSALLSSMMPVQPHRTLTDAEYQELIEMAYQQGALGQSEKEIILQIISLDRRTAADVMKSRSQMAAIPDDLSIEEMIAAARKYKHRRLPMYDETPDTIIGILNTRALLLNPDIDLADAIGFPSFVPETMNLLQLLKSLQRQQRGLAIVLDEFGGTAGIVTVEDILEEMIGPIRAEAQSEGFLMEKLGPGRWRVSGTLRLDDFRREYAPLGEVEEVETMGGLLAQLLEVAPSPGDSATFRGLKLTAQTTDERRARELLVETLDGAKR